MTLSKNVIDYTIRHQNRNDFFHSSGYASAQNQDGIGAAGGDNFKIRQKLEGNREFVRGYKDSEIGRTSHQDARPKPYVPNSSPTLNNNQPQPRQQTILPEVHAPHIPNRRTGI